MKYLQTCYRRITAQVNQLLEFLVGVEGVVQNQDHCRKKHLESVVVSECRRYAYEEAKVVQANTKKFAGGRKDGEKWITLVNRR